MLFAIVMSNTAQAENKTQRKAHHVVIVWLKQHGNANARRQYIKASKRLAKLPGVLSYSIGTPASRLNAINPAMAWISPTILR